MTLPLPPAPEKYERDKMQAIINAMQELQKKVFMPLDEIPMTDKDTGEAKVVFVASDVLTVDDA